MYYFILLTLTLCACNGDMDLGCKQEGACVCKASDGTAIDLRPLDVGEDNPFQLTALGNDGYNYEFNPCSGATDPNSGGGCVEVTTCRSQSGIYTAIGDNSGPIFKRDANGIYVQYTYTSGLTQTSKVYIVCDTEDTFSAKGATTIPFTYEMTMNTIHGCLGSKSKPGGGISVGSVLLIILVCLLVLYLIIGILFNKFKRGEEGAKVIPHVDFWKESPLLVKDGVVFIVGKVTGKRAGYEST